MLAAGEDVGGVGLWVYVDEEGTVTGPRQTGGQVDRDGGLAGAALLRGDSNNAHRQSYE